MQTRRPTALDPTPLTSLLLQKVSLQFIIEKTQQIQLANHILTQILPIQMQGHCTVANVQNGSMTLHLDNATWATQLRYQQTYLIRSFQKDPHFKELANLKIRVIPKTNTHKKVPRQIKMTGKAGQTIKNSAKTVENLMLKEALLRLASHAK